MSARRLTAAATLSLWLVALALLAGPVRWQIGHHLEHLLGDTISQLPRLTTDFALPVLGIGGGGLGDALLFWVVWIVVLVPPFWLLVAIARASDDARVAELLLFGGALALATQGLIAVLVAAGIWLPFALL